MSWLRGILYRLGGLGTPWPGRRQQICQVCEMALVHLELYCNVRILKIERDGSRGPSYVMQLETETVLSPDLLFDLQCYLARKINDVLKTRLNLGDFILVRVPIETAASGATQRDLPVPVIRTRVLAKRLAPAMLARGPGAAHARRPAPAANDSTPNFLGASGT